MCNPDKEKNPLDHLKNLNFVQKCTHSINFHTLNFLLGDTCIVQVPFVNKIQDSLRGIKDLLRIKDPNNFPFVVHLKCIAHMPQNYTLKLLSHFYTLAMKTVQLVGGSQEKIPSSLKTHHL
jgi:hypothetical protein